ncbi:MAG: hypothetical protein N4A53_15170 [Pelagimonas sp.]|jgi:hypothetical protein|nr:hypothetical protein [Pelagimonas sp.]
MPISYEIAADKSHVHTHYTGMVTRADFLNTFASFQQEPDFRVDMPQVTCLTEMTGTEYAFDEMLQDFAVFEAPFRAAGVQLAIAVYGAHDLTYGLARMFMALSENSPFMVTQLFDTRAEATAWALGLAGTAGP